MATKTQTQHETAREALMGGHFNIQRGDKIYTVLRHVGRNRMNRSISLIKIGEDRNIINLDYWASQLLDRKIDQDNGGLKIGGAGMDMGFALVYELSMALFCPDKYDHDAAYSLSHHWI